MSEDQLRKIANDIRKKAVSMHQRGTALGSVLSMADIIAVLYFDIMNIESPGDPDRDRFILSKGHAVSGVYIALAKRGFIKEEVLDTYLEDGSPLCAHPSIWTLPGIELSTGSLGHGLPVSVGMAWLAKHDNKKFKMYVLMGDGECQEGSVWEGALLASRLKLDNIIGIIDANNLQGYDRVGDIQPIETLKAKWEVFGWGVREVDGHNIAQLMDAFKNIPFVEGRPSVVIARTVKGKGIKEIENQLGWHYFSVHKDKVHPFVKELEGSE